MSAGPDAEVGRADPSRVGELAAVVEPPPPPGTFRRRRDACLIDVADVAANLPFVLRTVFGISALAVGANVTGVIVLTLVVAATNSTVSGHPLHVLVGAALVMLVVSVAAGIAAATLVQRRTLRWLLRGDTPSAADARRALRLPIDMGVIAAVLWTLSALVVGTAGAVAGLDAATIVAVAGGTVLAGLSSAGVTYLLVGRVSQPVAMLALEASPPRTAPVVGVRWRLLLVWVLTSGLPVVGLVLVLAAPHKQQDVVGVSIVVAVLAIAVGGLSSALLARAIGQPLRGLTEAFQRVKEGDLDVTVAVDDSGEIGLAQAGFNDMVAGLRERDRVKDLFGRHVGDAVAQEALRSGVTLAGEVRDVVAVFVDIVGSTRRSREAAPQEFVAMLNRFFEIVVEEVEAHGGLLNKFEGDAALCVFGAPVRLIDPASAALHAARRIRDRVYADGEVEIGVGVSAGPVVAGQVGTPNRLEFTVVGDAVNEAARLTELAKNAPRHVLASGDVIERAGHTERDCWTVAGETVLRGRDVPTDLWTA